MLFLLRIQQYLISQGAPEGGQPASAPMEQAIQKVAETETVAPTTLVQLILDGGFFVWTIVAVSFIVMTLVIERYFAYKYRFGGVNGEHLFKEVKKYLLANDKNRALDICRQYSTSPIGRVLAAGLQNYHKGISIMDSAMESEALYFIPKIQQRLGYIGSLANIGLLLGLLGTIGGLIRAFTAAGGAAVVGSGREMELAAGIGTAMLATAMGLTVAIPALFFHQFLSNKAANIVDEIQHYSSALKFIVLQMIEGKLDKE